MVQQKSASVRLDSGFASKPILQESQTRPGRDRVSRAPRTTHKMNSACRKRSETRIEASSEKHGMRL
jgi:hypothetical protein